MSRPPLVIYSTETEYRRHYERVYCDGEVTTFDGIRVYFSPSSFDHAFFESSNRDGRKDVFSTIRAQRIDWIKATLENPQAEVYEGWNKGSRSYDNTRRVSVVYENFVVIIALSLKRNGSLKGNFITCFQANNSINKIRQSPKWSRQSCLFRLRGRK